MNPIPCKSAPAPGTFRTPGSSPADCWGSRRRAAPRWLRRSRATCRHSSSSEPPRRSGPYSRAGACTPCPRSSRTTVRQTGHHRSRSVRPQSGRSSHYPASLCWLLVFHRCRESLVSLRDVQSALISQDEMSLN